MKTIKQLIKEANWLWHGSERHDIGTEDNPYFRRPKRENYKPIDQMIGTHFAADSVVGQNFASYSRGMAPNEDNGYGGGAPIHGALYKIRGFPRSKLLKVPNVADGDAHNIAVHVGSTVFKERPDLFHWWLRGRFRGQGGISIDTSQEIHRMLSHGKAPDNETRYGHAASRASSFKEYILSHDPKLEWANAGHDDTKDNIIQHYLETMHRRGIRGLVYHNTEHTETEGAQSKKCYVMLHLPHKSGGLGPIHKTDFTPFHPHEDDDSEA